MAIQSKAHHSILIRIELVKRCKSVALVPNPPNRVQRLYLAGSAIAHYITVIKIYNLYSKILPFAVYSLIGTGLFFVTFITPVTSKASEALQCQTLFAKELFSHLPLLQQIIEIQNGLYHPIEFLNANGKIRSFDLANNKLDNYAIEAIPSSGKLNAGIYRLVGQALILKVHKAPNQKIFPGSESRFLYRILGNLLSMTITEATIMKEFGTLETPNGKKYFYTIMEETFPGQTKYALKECWYDENKLIALRAIINSNPSLMQSIVASYLKIAKFGIVPSDPDFIITSQGKFLWIDTDFWILSKPINIIEHGSIAKSLLINFSKISPEIGLTFKAEMQKQIQEDMSISSTLGTILSYHLKLNTRFIEESDPSFKKTP